MENVDNLADKIAAGERVPSGVKALDVWDLNFDSERAAVIHFCDHSAAVFCGVAAAEEAEDIFHGRLLSIASNSL